MTSRSQVSHTQVTRRSQTKQAAPAVEAQQVPTDLAKQLALMQEELANHKSAIAQKELENQLTRAMGSQFDDEVQAYAD